MTSAPRSARSRPPEGPATMWLSSSTRKPVSGRRPVPPVAAPSVICDISLQVVTTSVRPVARWLTVALDARQAAWLGSLLPLFGGLQRLTLRGGAPPALARRAGWHAGGDGVGGTDRWNCLSSNNL